MRNQLVFSRYWVCKNLFCSDTSPLDKLEIADLKENIEDTERKANVDDQNKRKKDPLGHTDQETGEYFKSLEEGCFYCLFHKTLLAHGV